VSEVSERSLFFYQHEARIAFALLGFGNAANGYSISIANCAVPAGRSTRRC